MSSWKPSHALHLRLWMDASDTGTLTTDSRGITRWRDKSNQSLYLNRDTRPSFQPLTSVPSSIAWGGIAMTRATGLYQYIFEQSGQVYRSPDHGASWVPVTGLGSSHWQRLRMSTSGQYLLIVSLDGTVFTSSNHGVLWTRVVTLPDGWWMDGVISSSGQYQYVSGTDGVYRSADYGSTWILVPGTEDLLDESFVRMSTMGNIVMIGRWEGTVQISRDNGLTFSSQLPVATWSDAGLSSDGQYITVVAISGEIYTSSNFGIDFTHREPVIGTWSDVYMSDNGGIQLVLGQTGGSRISIDHGTTWLPLNTLPDTTRFLSAHVSQSGQYMMLGGTTASLYYSGDSGNTWRIIDNSPSTTWTSVFVSDDGFHALGTANERYPTRYRYCPPTNEASSVNMRNAVVFDSGGLTLQRPTAAYPVTLIVVFRGTSGALWDMSSGPFSGFFPSTLQLGASSMSTAPDLQLPSSTFNTSSIHVAGAVISANQLVLFKDGQEVGRVNVPGGNDISPEWYIGTRAANDASNYTGRVMEVLTYGNNLKLTYPVDWGRVHTYLSKKWGIPGITDVFPSWTFTSPDSDLLVSTTELIPGIGSDPHIVSMNGDRLRDLPHVQKWWPLIQHKDAGFIMQGHTFSPRRNEVYLDKVVIMNGPSNRISINFNKKTLKLSSAADGEYALAHDTERLVHWNITPLAPKKHLQFLCGRNPVLGQFWIRVDFLHRYINPYFPYADGQLTSKYASGVLIKEI